MRRCWTCNTNHDLDAPCPSSMVVKSMRSAGKPGNTIADHTASDWFEDPEDRPEFGPVFMAEHESDDACCGEGIVPGEDIRADGYGGWIHADTTCERLARE